MSTATNPDSLQLRLAVSHTVAIERVTAALQAEGFGILTEIDVKATMKKKLDRDFRNYVILGACNPSLAYRALSADLDMGLLLPCNVIVYEENGSSHINIIDPIQMLDVANQPELHEVAQEAQARLQRVVATLKG